MRVRYVFLFASVLVACEAPEWRPVEMAPSRPVPPPKPAPTPAPREIVYAPPSDCGDALVDHRLMVLHGRGEKHPDRVVVEAKLATCPRPLAPSPERCFAIAKERAERSRDWGPKHPGMIDLAAAGELCKDVPAPAPPPPLSCEEAKRRRDVLIASGKGENHPLRLAAESALVDCFR